MVRSSRGEKLINRARLRRAGSGRAAHREQAQATAALPARVAPDAATEPREEARPADPSLDVAVYTCDCGLVFEAPVVTSVGCPHCGGHQAW